MLVTGAGGFIGSHLTEQLVELGAETRALVRYNSANLCGWLDHSDKREDVEIVAGDLADRDSVTRATKGVDIVFHLGALISIPYSYEAPAAYLRTNIEGTLNVLMAARQTSARVIHTSTSEVYGSAITTPIAEEHPLQGQSPYSATKIGADKIAESFFLSFGLPVVTLRPFNTFGPRQSVRAVIPTIITQLAHGNRIKLGAVDPTRDLNYVSNTVDGFIAAATGDAALGETINLGSGREISIGDLAQLIAKLMNKDLEIATDELRLRPQKSEVMRLLADASKAERLLGWTPRIGLEEGLERTIDWITGNLGHFRIGEYVV